MVVSIEFLDMEPLENVITNLHYEVDKTIFFGYPEVIREMKEQTVRFLSRYCGDEELVFEELPVNDLQEIFETIRRRVIAEKQAGNQVFFDITGGDSLALVAFGILSKELETPMHLYDIAKGRLVELDEGACGCISDDVPWRRTDLDLDAYVEMYGGVINHLLHKDSKAFAEAETVNDLNLIWQISCDYKAEWNHFSNMLKMLPVDDKLTTRRLMSDVHSKMKKLSKLHPPRFQEMLMRCCKDGLITDYSNDGKRLQFTYKNRRVKEWFWDAGAPLEMKAYLTLRKTCSDCRVAVHLDWDGKIHADRAMDVLNEIDILMLKNNLPVFVSCKNGYASKEAMYELETVARRFGGKYARKMLIVPQGLSDADMLRAAEMDIEIVTNLD